MSKLYITGLLWEIHRWSVDFLHKGPVMRKTFPCHDVIIIKKCIHLQVPLPLVVLSLICLLLVAVVSIYFDPIVMGSGFLLFLCGVPLYWLQTCIKAKTSKHAGGKSDSKVHGTNMGPTWGRPDPGGPHVGHVNIAIWENNAVRGGHFILSDSRWKFPVTKIS